MQSAVSDTLVARIEAYAIPELAALGLELVETQFRREGPGWVLRLFIDREGGVTVDDCAAASRKVDAWLEEQDLIAHAYTLEVSSPGLERPLKREADFVRFAGRTVRIRLYRDEGQGKTLYGTLLGFQDGAVQLLVDKETLALPLEKISRARLTLE